MKDRSQPNDAARRFFGMLGEGHHFIETLLEALPVGLVIHTLDRGEIGFANSAFWELFATDLRPASSLESLVAAVWPEAAAQAEILPAMRRQGETFPPQFLLPGTGYKVSWQNIPLPRFNLMVSLVEDESSLQNLAGQVGFQQSVLDTLFDTSPLGIFRLDGDGRYQQVSRRWRETAGLTLAQALGEPWVVSVHPGDQGAMGAAWEGALSEGHAFQQECRFKTPGGRTSWVQVQIDPLANEAGQVTGHVGTLTDISHRKRNEEEIRQLAYYDSLTRLPNRSFFMDQLGRAMSVAKRTGHQVVLLSCDLDNFKDINDTLGHDQGDLLLQSIATRLNSCIRRGDTLCRLGGDEFALLLPTVTDVGQVEVVARKIMASLQQPFPLTHTQVFISTSIGIAVHPEDAQDGATLIQNADMAMNVAKDEGKDRYRFFAADMNRRAMDRMQLEGCLRSAVSREELSLVYQPQYELGSGRLVGVEALLRWHSEELGQVPPDRFIPVAEATGQIHGLGRWVLDHACRQAKLWQDRHGQLLTVAVNLSGRQFMDGDIVSTVTAVLERTGLDPTRLELEITETVLMRDAPQALETLNRLHAAGVRFAIDDFGTGYSSLVYLKQFPIDRIKIAREFVQDITTDSNDAAIAGTVVDMALNLGMKALAEGVETREQADVLRDMGCHEVQGFFFGRPVPPVEIDALLD